VALSLSKIPDTSSAIVGSTKYRDIDTCIVRYYYRFYTVQRAKIPDTPVKYRTPGNPTKRRRRWERKRRKEKEEEEEEEKGVEETGRRITSK